MRPSVIGVAMLFFFALTACSASASPPTVASIAEKAGCTGFQPDSGFVLYVREHGECKVAGQTMTVSTFNDAAARANYLKVAKTFGGVYGHGNLWVIEGQSGSAVAQATKAAGGVS